MKFQTNLCPTFSSIPCFQNWSCEFRKWLGNERLKVYTVTSEKRVKVSSIRLQDILQLPYLKYTALRWANGPMTEKSDEVSIL